MLLWENEAAAMSPHGHGWEVLPFFFFFFESFCFVYVNFVGVRGIKKDPTFGISEGGR